MENKEIILSIKQAKNLTDLGADMSDATIVSYLKENETTHKEEIITTLTSEFAKSSNTHLHHVYRYTLEEILEKLPNSIENYNLFMDKNDRVVYYADDFYTDDDQCLIFKEGKSLLEAAYEVYCWYLENLASLTIRQQAFMERMRSAFPPFS